MQKQTKITDVFHCQSYPFTIISPSLVGTILDILPHHWLNKLLVVEKLAGRHLDNQYLC